jgi:hypothetical protein
MPRSVTRENLGAWLLRCNPRNEPELAQWAIAGNHRIDRWCVADNYRTRLMTAGDVVMFWVSGDGRLLTRGIWGVGHVLGVNGVDAAPSRAARGRSTTAEHRKRPEVEVDIPLLSEPISARSLHAVGIDDLEVQVQPFGSNPSWMSRRQLARLAALVPLPMPRE